MTKPKMTIAAVQKAQQLIEERSRIARARWDALCSGVVSLTDIGQKSEPVDDQLSWAIEEFRNRKLAAIDVELRKLGVDPSAEDPEPEPEPEPRRIINPPRAGDLPTVNLTATRGNEEMAQLAQMQADERRKRYRTPALPERDAAEMQ